MDETPADKPTPKKKVGRPKAIRKVEAPAKRRGRPPGSTKKKLLDVSITVAGHKMSVPEFKRFATEVNEVSKVLR